MDCNPVMHTFFLTNLIHLEIISTISNQHEFWQGRCSRQILKSERFQSLLRALSGPTKDPKLDRTICKGTGQNLARYPPSMWLWLCLCSRSCVCKHFLPSDTSSTSKANCYCITSEATLDNFSHQSLPLSYQIPTTHQQERERGEREMGAVGLGLVYRFLPPRTRDVVS